MSLKMAEPVEVIIVQDIVDIEISFVIVDINISL